MSLFLSCFGRLCMMEIVFTSCCKLVGIMLMLKGEGICLLCVNLISLCFPDWKLLLDWVYVEFNELNGASDIDDVLRPDIVSVELRFSDSFPFYFILEIIELSTWSLRFLWIVCMSSSLLFSDQMFGPWALLFFLIILLLLFLFELYWKSNHFSILYDRKMHKLACSSLGYKLDNQILRVSWLRSRTVTWKYSLKFILNSISFILVAVLSNSS